MGFVLASFFLQDTCFSSYKARSVRPQGGLTFFSRDVVENFWCAGPSYILIIVLQAALFLITVICFCLASPDAAAALLSESYTFLLDKICLDSHSVS